MSESTTQVLSEDDLQHQVVSVIKSAEKYVLLVTAYLRTWRNLDIAIDKALKRGVRVHLVIRTPDGSTSAKNTTKKEIAKLKALGVGVDEVKRLHAKFYLNEREVVLTSFNLVKASQESVELGIHTTDMAIVDGCFDSLAYYAAAISELRDESAPKKANTRKRAPSVEFELETDSARCIGCGSGRAFNPLKPLCLSCYRKSKRATNFDALSDRSCHLCGESLDATVEKPLCYACYKSLSAADKKALKPA